MPDPNGDKNSLDLYHPNGTELVLDGGTVEAGALKLLKRLEEIEADMVRLHSERSAINTALSIMGVRVEQNRPAHFPSQQESQYAIHKPFADMPLTTACLKVLSDQPGASLTKTQVEYLVTRGGYKFSTSDSKNSVSVTLRRLAEDGKIEAQHTRGATGNLYRYTERSTNAVEDSRATTGPKTESGQR